MSLYVNSMSWLGHLPNGRFSSTGHNLIKPTVTYEALNIIEVIPPEKIEDDGSVELF